MDTNAQNEFNRLLQAMVDSYGEISDLLFVPGKLPQVEVHGTLESPALGEAILTGARIESFARVILDGNAKLTQDLATTGACDCSYALGETCRFRVNIYKQKNHHAMVMRRLATQVPSLDTLGMAPIFKNLIQEKNGLIFVTGGAGNGKTTTLAALLNEINQTSKVHVVTLEDPVEFLHPQLKSTFSQREMGRDFFSFPDGLRSALRQAPKVIFVGEIRDRETMEIALIAGETGHLVFSTLHTISADQTIHRILGMFSKDEEQLVRERLSGSLRYIVGQRLVPKKTGGRHLVTELMGSSLRTREAIELGENDNRRLHDIIEAGGAGGWHSFEQSLLKAYETGIISEDTAMQYSINKPTMRQRLDVANGHVHAAVHRAPKAGVAVPMMVVSAAPPPPPPAPVAPLPPTPKAEPHPGLLKGILNGFM
ncbi:MAG TPA: PilT/PilU family type 4a pilus ATPase [Candidatus Acidoferrales bacterium]|jgi:twitching motility protein PilT|nr:PilT/PilU family type 4a pilus ATPase [Candidatus Acidoferrales bacterium]